LSNEYKPTELETINRIQRQIIIHSIIYYEFDDNIWSDFQYDDTCKRMVELIGKKEFKKSTFYEDFKDFDGSTGYHLGEKYKSVYGHTAARLLKYHSKITC
jgi:hypothetical protein